MSKPCLLIVLTFAALVGVPSHASAVPIPQGMANTLCKGDWRNLGPGMATEIRMCVWCETNAAGAPKCDYFLCDQDGLCEWITIERKKPTGPWKVVQPKLPKTAVAPKK